MFQVQGRDLADEDCLELVHHEGLLLEGVPEGGRTPGPLPLPKAAPILSRVLSPSISRSNSAKDISMFRVRRPIASAVEMFWVTETKETSLAARRRRKAGRSVFAR